MEDQLRELARLVGELNSAVDELVPYANRLGVANPITARWFALLRNKLVPQFRLATRGQQLIVAFIGGTNTGKSLLFNQLVGETVSAVTPFAAQTKQPVCVVSESLADQRLLAELFPEFTLKEWQNPDDPRTDAPEHVLYWRSSKRLPEWLLLLDTPDIDSDVEVNWERARLIRDSADLLIGVLTAQKYNDAAIKQFFRAVSSEKPVIIAFNQLHLPEDRDVFPIWLDEFCATTGIKPYFVFAIPHDPVKAEQLQLDFFQVLPHEKTNWQQSDLRQRISQVHYKELKWASYRADLRDVVAEHDGLPGFLAKLEQAAEEFQTVLSRVEEALSVQRWPVPPDELVAGVLEERVCQACGIGSFRHASALSRAGRWVASLLFRRKPELTDIVAEYREKERQTVLAAVRAVRRVLEQVRADSRPELQKLLDVELGGRRIEDVDRRADDRFCRLEGAGKDCRKLVEDIFRAVWEQTPDAQQRIQKWLQWRKLLGTRRAVQLALRVVGITRKVQDEYYRQRIAWMRELLRELFADVIAKLQVGRQLLNCPSLGATKTLVSQLQCIAAEQHPSLGKEENSTT